MPETKDIFTHNKGSFERLNEDNYPTWGLNCRYLLLAVDAWDIVTGEEVAPIVPEDGNALQIGVASKLFKDFKLKKQNATFIIFNSCAEMVQAHINSPTIQRRCEKLLLSSMTPQITQSAGKRSSGSSWR
jgi:hypothetical protein